MPLLKRAPVAGALTPGSSADNTDDAEKRAAEASAAAVRGFLAELAAAHVSERTARLYVGHLGRFAAWLRADDGGGGVGLLEASGADVRAYRTHLAATQKPASVNGALGALRRFYGWAHGAGRLRGRADPTARVRPAAQQPLAPKGFSALERRRLVAEAERTGPMASAVVATLLHTGLRVEELTGLTWDALQPAPRSGSARVVGKGKKLRLVPLNATPRDALAAIRPQEPAGAVFRGKRGPYTPRGVRDLLAVLGRRAGVVGVHPHRFRHDAARRLVDAGVDLPTVAALLGHSRLDTVRRYSQPGEAELHRAAARLEAD